MLRLKALKAAQAVMETVPCGVSGRGIEVVDRLSIVMSSEKEPTEDKDSISAAASE
jgi:hypothetical protein